MEILSEIQNIKNLDGCNIFIDWDYYILIGIKGQQLRVKKDADEPFEVCLHRAITKFYEMTHKKEENAEK